MAHDNDTFWFLDLPKDLRLMIYESLKVKTAYRPFDYSISDISDFPDHSDPTLKPSLRYRSLQLLWMTVPGLSILRTCRLIHNEASPILARSLKDSRREPIRVIATSSTFPVPKFSAATSPHASTLSILRNAVKLDLTRYVRRKHSKLIKCAKKSGHALESVEYDLDLAIRWDPADTCLTIQQRFDQVFTREIRMLTNVVRDAPYYYGWEQVLPRVQICLAPITTEDPAMMDTVVDEANNALQRWKRVTLFPPVTVRVAGIITEAEWQDNWAEQM